jgi:hypothetical protein
LTVSRHRFATTLVLGMTQNCFSQRHDDDNARLVVQPPSCFHPHPRSHSFPSLSWRSRTAGLRIWRVCD